ncbi:MAG TPA: VOC family protein [Mycobacteriales bacterium]
MTVTAQLDLAIFDAADIEKVGSFYAALTGWDVVRKDADRLGRRPQGRGPVRRPHPRRSGGRVPARP